MLRGVIFYTAIALAAAPLAARAEDTWKQHYERGTTAFDLEKYLDAAKEFESAYELKQNAAFLFNIGQAYRLAGQSEKAIGFYKTYLRRLPEASNRPEVEARIAELEKLVEQQKKALAEPPHGTIANAPISPLPMPVQAAPAPAVPMRHFAIRGGLGAANASAGVSLEFRPTFVGFLIGTGYYTGAAGLTFGSSDNTGGFYVDAVYLHAHSGLGHASLPGPAVALSLGWDIRFVPWLSTKLGVGAGHNFNWTTDRVSGPHILTVDAAIGTVF
jgi:hypothetical protein